MNIQDEVFKDLNADIQWIKDNTIFLTIHGSIAYGLNTPESDVDVRGICTVPKEYLFGFNKNFNEYIKKDPDCTIFNIRKFFNLTSQGNPNTLELLFVNPKHHILVTDIGQTLIDNRNYFLSKQLKERYIGYAKAQAHRIKNHRRWLLNPMQSPPTRKEMGLPEKPQIEKNQFDAIKSLINKKIESWNPDFEPFSESQKIYLQGKVSEILSEMHIGLDEKWSIAARTIGLNENLIQIIKKEKEYENKLEDWASYLNWKKNRNPKRAAQEAKYGYDCFTDDTEFLTDNGFKKFDDINEKDKLATVFINQTDMKMEHRAHHFGIEYQNYTERFDALFNGNLYNFYGTHLDICVTPNHRMLFQPFSRNLKKPIGIWMLEPASNIGEFSETFNFLKTITPNTKNYSNGNVFDDLPISSEDYMKLMGAFLSDGTFGFNSNNEPDVLNINQKEHNRLHPWMKRFYKKHKDKLPISLYSYKRKIDQYRKKEMQEIILSIRDKSIINKLYKDCGHFKGKHIPRWVFSLSKRLMEIMYNHMHLGDGTVRNTNFKSNIYYTSVQQLANDTQELAVLCGWETSLYGPYTYVNKDGREVTSYQVHINKNSSNIDRATLNNNLKKISVINQRVVCFSVPNSTLIVRRNGHISIQGNCKHGTQLVRLLRLGKEVLETGKMQVERIHDRDELMGIKTGAWTYDQLIEYADKIEQEVKEAYNNSKLPNQPNINYLDNLCVDLIERSLRKNV